MVTAALILFALFGALVVAWFLMLVRVERLVKTAESRLALLPCPRCGAPIGAETATAAAAAKAEQIRRVQEALAAGILMRIPPYWPVTCPTCAAPLRFDPGEARNPLTPE